MEAQTMGEHSVSDEIKKEQTEAPDESDVTLSDQQLEEASGGEVYDYPGEYAQKYDGIDSTDGSIRETSVERKTR